MTAPTPPEGRARYTNVSMLHDVYVDSMWHYHGHAVYFDQKSMRRYVREYCWDIVDPLGFQAPKYLEAECERQWLALLKSGEARFYEYDRDGNRRYTDLRYYDPADVARIVETLERRARESDGRVGGGGA